MIQMFINNTEVLSDKEFTITEEMLNTSSTILNNCYPKIWDDDKDYTSRFYFPADYSKCKIYKDNTLIFAGAVQNTGNIALNPRYPKYCSLQILDFKCLLSEGETLDFVISNKTIKEAISMVVDAIKQYGFVLGNIKIYNGDDVIGAYSTLNKSAYDVFQYLADISQSRWTTRMIDENTVAIDFYDPLLMERGEDIEYTTEWWENNKVIDLSYSYSSRDYRNKQIMISNEVYANIMQDESVLANGYGRTFNTSQKIGTISEIQVNNIDKTIATKSDKDQGIEADFYYTPGEATFESNESQQPYTAGTTIKISYIPLVKGREIIYNNDEVDRIKNSIGRKGVIARYENRNDILNNRELNAIGQTYLKYKGHAEITLTLKTEIDLYNVGQVVFFDAPIGDLTNDYMVKKKETHIIATANKVFYTYELSSSFNSENAINYFDNQRNKSQGNLSDGEFITRNIDIENVAGIIFYGLTNTEIEYTNNNILNCGLDAPLNN